MPASGPMFVSGCNTSAPGTEDSSGAQLEHLPFVFASDASLSGFGFYLESTPTPPGTVDSPQLGVVPADRPVNIATDMAAAVPTLAALPQHLRVGATFSGSYSPEHAHLHHSHTQIAWCELLAVVACAATYAPLLTGQSLLFYVDNSTDVHIINRQATRSKALAGLLRQLYALALRYNLSHTSSSPAWCRQHAGRLPVPS